MAGRPKKELDADQLQGLAAIGATQREIASYFGVSAKTVERRLQEPDYQSAYDQGEGEFKVSLRRLMFKRAEEGNAAVLIFLAKNYLGMADKPDPPGLELPYLD
jgi:hypothetical protein